MANVFTPNGDGNNDRFFPQGKGISVIYSFKVYSRWGELMYEAYNIPINDENYGWDGTFKGIPLDPDVYVYSIDGICILGDRFFKKGDVSLIR
jgi:gliding motility-associated-like protein